MTKKKLEYNWAKQNKIAEGLYDSPMYKLIKHTNKLVYGTNNQGMSGISKMMDIVNSLNTTSNLGIKIQELSLQSMVSPSIQEITETIGSRFIDSQLMVENPFANDDEEISAIELELDPFGETDINEKEAVELIHTTPKIIKSIYEDQGILKIIDPRKFEEVVAELLYAKGFEVQLTKQTRDGGYDILAITKVSGFPIEMIVECKRYKNTVGVDIIRSFCDVINEMKPNKGLLVTTSYFSPEAKEKKRKMGAMLDLHDRDDLLNWIMEYIAIKN